MADKTKIEWADASWSPITGCSPVSAGCQNCYAQRMARRLAGRFGYPETPNHFDVTFHQDRLVQPLKWKKPRRIFVSSMGDLFHEDVEWNWQYKIFEMIMMWNHHTFMVLTKRPDMMQERLKTINFHLDRNYTGQLHPFKNLWLGATVEHPDYLWRIDELLKIPAAVRFVSVEPMLSEIDLRGHLYGYCPTHDFHSGFCDHSRCPDVQRISLIIAGPETGPNARWCSPEWMLGLYDQCKAAGVPFFDKRKNYLAREFPKGA